MNLRYINIMLILMSGPYATGQSSSPATNVSIPTLIQLSANNQLNASIDIASNQLKLDGEYALSGNGKLAYGFNTANNSSANGYAGSLGFSIGMFVSNFKYLKQNDIQTTDIGFKLTPSRRLSFSYIENNKWQNQNGLGKSALSMDWTDRGAGAHYLREKLTTKLNGIDQTTEHNVAHIDYKSSMIGAQLLTEHTAPDKGEDSDHNMLSLSITPDKFTTGSLLYDKNNQNLHELASLYHQFGTMRLGISRDITNNGSGLDTLADLLHFEISRNKPNNLLFEERHIQDQNGSSNILSMDANYRLNKPVLIHFNHYNIARGVDSTSTDTLNCIVSAGKTGEIKGNIVTSSTNQTSTNILSVSAKEVVGQAVQITSGYSESETNYRSKGDPVLTTETASSLMINNIRPLPALLSFKNTVVSFSYNNSQKDNQVQSEAVSGKIAGTLVGNNVGFQYNSSQAPGGLPQTSNTITLDNKNPKLPANFDVLYRTYDTVSRPDGMTDQIYNVQLNLASAIKLAGSYSMAPDKLNSTNQIKTNSIGVIYNLDRKNKLNIDYSQMLNSLSNSKATRISTLFSVQPAKLVSVKFGCSYDEQYLAAQCIQGYTLLSNYDYHLDSNNYLSVALSHTFNQYSSDQSTANLQFKTIF